MVNKDEYILNMNTTMAVCASRDSLWTGLCH